MSEITRLEQLRIDAGLSITELALRAGVLRQIVSNAENDKGASPKSLAAIGRVLGVPASTLLLKVTPEIVAPDLPKEAA